MSEPTPNPTPTPSGEPTPNPTPSEWFGGFPEDLKGYVQTKGFKDPQILADSYRNLEKMVGVKEKLVQVPDDLGSAEMEKVWNRLGRPEKPDGYGFKSADADFDAWAKDTFHKSGLTSNQAKNVVDKWNSYVEKLNADMTQKTESENAQKIESLKKEWGGAYDQNLNIAKGAAKQFGISEEMIDAMEKSIGFEPVMKMLNSIGAKVGEAEYVGGGNGGSGSGILTPAQAKSEIASLTQDADFRSKLLKGDVQSKKRWESLHKMSVEEVG